MPSLEWFVVGLRGTAVVVGSGDCNGRHVSASFESEGYRSQLEYTAKSRLDMNDKVKQFGVICGINT